jgi:ubiquinone/menaquinone biosynthesis C-methylase UbiE
MPLLHNLAMIMFGRPRGLPGAIGGLLMGPTNLACGKWAVECADIKQTDRVLEIGFGSGTLIEHVAAITTAGHVAGIDPSTVMLGQARRRNAAAISRGQVELREGVAERLQFGEASFDKVIAVNSPQLWTDPAAALGESRRVMKSGGRLVLAFTRYSGQARDGLLERLEAAQFTTPAIVDGPHQCFCAVATRP